jgi:hypothetical protein
MAEQPNHHEKPVDVVVESRMYCCICMTVHVLRKQMQASSGDNHEAIIAVSSYHKQLMGERDITTPTRSSPYLDVVAFWAPVCVLEGQW